MATRRGTRGAAAAASSSSAATSTREPRPEDQILDADEEAEVQELFELSTMVSTIDRM